MIRRASGGDVDAQVELALLYERGNGEAPNYREAVRWHRAAAETGDAQAQVNLGLAYALGRGVAKGRRKANLLYRAAARGGNVRAMCNLGMVYLDGLGVRRNASRARREWLQRAAALGDDLAAGMLGDLYRDGIGGAIDLRKAVRCYKAAAATAPCVSVVAAST